MAYTAYYWYLAYKGLAHALTAILDIRPYKLLLGIGTVFIRDTFGIDLSIKRKLTKTQFRELRHVLFKQDFNHPTPLLDPGLI